MAKASKKHIGAGALGKGDGSGGLSGNADIAENIVLSNRDKAQHSKDRGQDGKWVQSEQRHDSELDHLAVLQGSPRKTDVPDVRTSAPSPAVSLCGRPETAELPSPASTYP